MKLICRILRLLDCELLIKFPFCRDCVLEENVLISKGTSVGAGTVITNSIIGRNCVIGRKHSFFFLHVCMYIIIIYALSNFLT